MNDPLILGQFAMILLASLVAALATFTIKRAFDNAR